MAKLVALSRYASATAAMTLRFILLAGLPALVACSASRSQSAQSTAEPPFSVTEVARFDSPWALDFLPGSGVPKTNVALVTEKAGKLWLIGVTTGKRQEVAGVPKVHVEGQGGLADVVAHPDFAGNQRIYLSFPEAGPGGTSGATVGYGRLILGAGPPRLEGYKTIWRQQPKEEGGAHYSERIAFAPDGTMFITSGERFQFTPAQDPNVDLGKVVRLNDDGSVPADNPFASRGGVTAQIWSLGHRNPLGLKFAGDGKLWEIEMGPMGGDELNLNLRGRNYGYPIVSNGDHYDGKDIPDHPTRPEFEAPKAWWTPVISPGDFILYSGPLFPRWRGDALVAGLSSKALIHVDIDGTGAREVERWDMGERIREVEQGPDGAVWLLEDGPGGRLLKLTPKR